MVHVSMVIDMIMINYYNYDTSKTLKILVHASSKSHNFTCSQSIYIAFYHKKPELEFNKKFTS